MSLLITTMRLLFFFVPNPPGTLMLSDRNHAFLACPISWPITHFQRWLSGPIKTTDTIAVFVVAWFRYPQPFSPALSWIHLQFGFLISYYFAFLFGEESFVLPLCWILLSRRFLGLRSKSVMVSVWKSWGVFPKSRVGEILEFDSICSWRSRQSSIAWLIYSKKKKKKVHSLPSAWQLTLHLKPIYLGHYFLHWS